MRKILYQLYNIFTVHERRETYWLLLAILLMASFDIAGIMSIMPFMAVVADPNIAANNSYLSWIYDKFNFISVQYFLFFLGCMSLLMLTVAAAINITGNWFLVRFVRKFQHTVGKRLMAQYLHQPYTFHLKRNPSDLAENILIETSRIIELVLIPLLNLLVRGTIAAFIILLIFLIDPRLALTTVLILGGAYTGVYMWIAKILDRIGKERHQASQILFKTSSEIFNGIKTIKLHGKEDVCLQRYSDPSECLTKHLRTHQITDLLPRYFLEWMVFGGMVVVTTYYIMVLSSWSEVIPMLVLYAFAGYRLMPSLQHVYVGMSALKFNASTLDVIYKDINDTKGSDPSSNKDKASSPLNLKKRIELKDVTFFYPEESSPALRDINLTIPVNSQVGIVGSSGAGKTTLVDLILGLIRPHQGSILIDGVSIDGNNLSSWQKNLGYVPQNNLLFDDTIASNIAFWVSKDNFDIAQVISSAKIAQIHDFIMNDLPNGYDTTIGEQGIRLSAGQKQRIGIARALYQKPSILVLDEATNTLDNITEKKFFKALHDLAQEMTIISVAHRISTVKHCDEIYMLENKTIVGRGTFDGLIKSCPQFVELNEASDHSIK